MLAAELEYVSAMTKMSNIFWCANFCL